MILGQPELSDYFNSISIFDLPHTIMLLGDIGCGKHTLIKDFCHKNDVEMFDISKEITSATLDEISMKTSIGMYIIDSSLITEKEQNAILKFLEEPNEYTYICVICSNKNLLLDTVINRCRIFEFKPYSKEFLLNYASGLGLDDVTIACEIAQTIGQLKELIGQNLQECRKNSITFATKVGNASLGNTLSLVQKFNYDKDFDKVSFDTFINLLCRTLCNLSKDDPKYFKGYNIARKFAIRVQDKRLNKMMLVEDFLITYWLEMRSK